MLPGSMQADLAMAQTPPADPAAQSAPATPPPRLRQRRNRRASRARRGAQIARDLSPWGMFMAADIVVKAVMVASPSVGADLDDLVCQGIELMAARRRLRHATDALGKARSWSEAMAGAQGRDEARPR